MNRTIKEIAVSDRPVEFPIPAPDPLDTLADNDEIFILIPTDGKAAPPASWMEEAVEAALKRPAIVHLEFPGRIVGYDLAEAFRRLRDLLRPGQG